MGERSYSTLSGGGCWALADSWMGSEYEGPNSDGERGPDVSTSGTEREHRQPGKDLNPQVIFSFCIYLPSSRAATSDRELSSDMHISAHTKPELPSEPRLVRAVPGSASRWQRSH